MIWNGTCKICWQHAERFFVLRLSRMFGNSTDGEDRSMIEQVMLVLDISEGLNRGSLGGQDSDFVGADQAV